MELTAEMGALKTRMKSTWMAGDYATFAKPMAPGALAFLDRLGLDPGESMLDAGCGAGQLAIPAARRGVRVTAVDIATNSVAQARAWAAAEGLEARIVEGDVEALELPDGEFDVVVSLFAAMFAPRPERVAAELFRLAKPGGRVVMANWTPEGFVGQMFGLVGKFVPPPALAPSPLAWGVESTVRERFRGFDGELELARRSYPFTYECTPRETVEFYRRHYGPMNRAFAALDEAAAARLRAELEQLWTRWNGSDAAPTRYAGEYLEVVLTKH